MPNDHAQYDAIAWRLTTEQIGLKLRERYPLSEEFPPDLTALVTTLIDQPGTVEVSRKALSIVPAAAKNSSLASTTVFREGDQD